MKHLILFMTVFTLMLVQNTSGRVAENISCQGVLTDASGNAVADGDYSSAYNHELQQDNNSGKKVHEKTTTDYSWIPPRIQHELKEKFPNDAIPTASIRSIHGDSSYYANMLMLYIDPSTAYAIKGDFNGDQQIDYAILLFPSSAQREDKAVELKLVLAISSQKRNEVAYQYINYIGHYGTYYYLTLVHPGEYLTAAGKGYAAREDAPRKIELKYDAISVTRVASSSWIIYWDGNEFLKVFTSD